MGQQECISLSLHLAKAVLSQPSLYHGSPTTIYLWSRTVDMQHNSHSSYIYQQDTPKQCPSVFSESFSSYFLTLTLSLFFLVCWLKQSSRLLTHRQSLFSWYVCVVGALTLLLSPEVLVILLFPMTLNTLPRSALGF